MKSANFFRFLAIVLALAGFSATPCEAGEVSRNQALAIANQVVNRHFPAEFRTAAGNISIASGLKSEEPFYVCNAGEIGFVLIAKNDFCPPVLGFSWEGKYPSQTSAVPPVMSRVIDNIRSLCGDYAARPEVNPAITAGWADYLLKSAPALKTGIISPLLTTSWNCDSTFFDLYPANFRAGGPVAIAMGQVFRYFGRPDAGSGELCYLLDGHGELCTQFGLTELRFDRMSNTLGNPAVDSLIYIMAVTSMMQPTGASLDAYKQTLPLHFNYSDDMRAVESWDYNLGEVIRHQLSMRRPVPSEWLGQAFVIDGYFPDNLYHFNMGWGGDFNGYYLLDYPVVKVDTDHSLLTCYTDYHPKSTLPVATNLNAVTEGDSIRITWQHNINDTTLLKSLQRYVLLRDGLIPIAQSSIPSMLVSPEMMGGSSNLRLVSDFGQLGASEMSPAFRYITDMRVANISSLQLRMLINTRLGVTDLLRQPFVGELDLIRDLEITFPDMAGIEKLPKLVNLRVDGTNVHTVRDGEYLQRLLHLRFYNCSDFNFTMFGRTRSLIQLYGYDFLPFDLYEFRHNTDLGLAVFTSTGTNPNMLMDLYGADKYFPKLADFFLRHLSAGINGNYENCFVSYETYNDVYPKIKSNQNLLLRTQPSSFAPCYPTPLRDANVPDANTISWQSNFTNATGVYYNVYLGKSRTAMDLVGVFQSEKSYMTNFDANSDYFWRVEAYHADSTYYSGVYHFSTYQDLPIPFVDKFDSYYTGSPVADESPFWVNFDNTLTGKAVANRTTKFDGYYSLELKPRSDAGLVIKNPELPAYFIEFRFMNQGGQVAVELLQKHTTTNENTVNTKIEFTGANSGLLTYGESTFAFNYLPDRWNRVNISVSKTTGMASLSLNESLLKEWQWTIQMGGTANTNPFKGIRFVNSAAAAASTAFIDNVVIDQVNPASTGSLELPSIGIVYLAGAREVVLSGVEPEMIREIALYDIRGRKLVFRQNPENLTFSVGASVPQGVYLVVVNRKDGAPVSKKIAILE